MSDSDSLLEIAWEFVFVIYTGWAFMTGRQMAVTLGVGILIILEVRRIND